jgi:hypothetical protein
MSEHYDSPREISEAALDNLKNTIDLRDAGLASDEVLHEVADITGRTLGETIFGACDFPHYCKFYGENPSFCDRECNVPVWDQI